MQALFLVGILLGANLSFGAQVQYMETKQGSTDFTPHSAKVRLVYQYPADAAPVLMIRTDEARGLDNCKVSQAVAQKAGYSLGELSIMLLTKDNKDLRIDCSGPVTDKAIDANSISVNFRPIEAAGFLR